MSIGLSRCTVSVVRNYLNLLKETLNCLEVHLEFYHLENLSKFRPFLWKFGIIKSS